MRNAIVVLFMFAISVIAQPQKSIFDNPNITTRYSKLLQEKQAVYDSLLPALNGDQAFQELIRTVPGIWSFERLDKLGEMTTKLNVEIVYIDGLREDQFCEIGKNGEASSAVWSVSMGVDFISGESNTVPIHIKQCLEEVRNSLGYQVRKGDRIIEVPPRKILDEIKKSNIPAALDPELQTKVLKAHREVNLSGDCPTDIEAYAILLDVWDQVKGMQMDLAVLQDHLNPDRNGGKIVKSCAFSREWNQKYSETAQLECDESELTCKYTQSEDGTTRWLLDPQTDRFQFVPLKILFINFGGKSIHDGGSMLDLRILALSNSMFLEAYLDEKGMPVSLGLITVPEK